MTRHALAGKTLIELVVILTITTFIMMLATTTLVTLFRIERQIRGAQAQDIALARLSSRWRTDVHAAIAGQAQNGCELTLPGGKSIHYSFAAPAVIREVHRGDIVEHRDAFVLSRRAQVDFVKAGLTRGEEIRLVVKPGDSPDHAYATPVHTLTIAAALNLHGQPAQAEALP